MDKENALAMYIFACYVINYDFFSWCCKESQGLYHPTQKRDPHFFHFIADISVTIQAKREELLL